MDTLTGFLTMIPHRWDAGDTTDRLHYQYTTLIIALFAITLFASEYVGAPIQCWFPAEFLPTWESYGESYCFIKNTYYLPWDKDVPEQYEKRDKEEIGYYQWVPIVLIAQALLFYVPCLIWTALNWQSGCLPSEPTEGEVFLYTFRRREDAPDAVDRLSYQYTPVLLGLALTVLMLMQWGALGEAINCWTPAEFTPLWSSYTDNYCYAQGTYFLAPERRLLPPNSYTERERLRRAWYAYVPLCLLLQVILFMMPHFIWKRLKDASGINVKGVLWCASAVKKDVTKGTRQMMVDSAAGHLGESIGLQKDLSNVQGNFCGTLFYGKLYGMWVTGLYLFVKLLYILNVVVQFLIMNAFLRTKYTFWGWGILKDILNGVQWEESGHFPRVTMCDFQVRVLGNIHRWSVQCVLMINMFNEKIYVFLWWWFLIIGLLSMLSFAYWLAVSVIPSQRVAFVEKYLRVMKCIEKKPSTAERQLVARFCSEQLRPDGVFLIRMIQTNGGDLLTGEILKSMFTFWKDPALWWADNAERFAAMEQQEHK